MNEVFNSIEVPVDANGDGQIDDGDDLDGDGRIDTELRHYFNERALAEYCVVPDADSFDDYEDEQLGVPRGVTPITTTCEADGIETGPLHEELYPSKWCRKNPCFESTGEAP